jgi:hypothetical protein
LVLTALKPLHYITTIGRNLLGINWGHNKVENKEWEGGGGLNETM